MPECDGLCVTGADVGVPEYPGIAYAHPGCPLHGDGVRCECGQPDRCNSYTHDPAWQPAPVASGAADRTSTDSSGEAS